MNAHRTFAVALLALCSCGSPLEQQTQDTKLQLVVSKDPLLVETDHTFVLQLLVIGEGADEATISAPDLPPFATLRGSILTLSPGREYQGDYTLTLVATAGAKTSSAKLQVSVIRFNSAPVVNGIAQFDSTGFVDVLTNPSCFPRPCRLHGTPVLGVYVVDAEGDSVTVEMEVVPVGQALSGVPTHRATAPVGTDRGPCLDAHPFHACIEVELTGLATGQQYVYATRVRDSLGATGPWSAATPPEYGFVLEP
jgi:hypothetical protein